MSVNFWRFQAAAHIGELTEILQETNQDNLRMNFL